MIPNLPYQKQLSGVPAGVIANPNRMNPILMQRHLRRKPRKQLMGVLFFCFIAFASIINLNMLLSWRFNIFRAASIFILISTISTLLIFKLNIIRDLGKVGKSFLIFFLTFLGIATMMSLITARSAIDFYNIGYVFQVYGGGFLVLFSAALGARHLVVAYSSKTLIRIIFFIGLIMVSSLYLGIFWPSLLYAYNMNEMSGRALGFFSNPNQAGYTACLVTVVCYANLAAEKKYQKKLWILAGILFSALAVFATYSRGAIITFIILSGLQLFWASKTNRKLIAMTGVLSMILMVGYIFSKSTSNTPAYGVQRRVNMLKGLFSGRVLEGAEGRIVVASYAIKRWLNSPILGNGFGTGSSGKENTGGAHNAYILVLVESGIIPFFLLGIFAFVFFKESIKCKDPAIRTLCLGTAIVTFLACATTHGIFGQKHHLLLLGICFGALSGVKYLIKNEPRLLRVPRKSTA